MLKLAKIVLSTVAVAGLLVACGDDGDGGSTPTPIDAPRPDAATPDAAIDAGADSLYLRLGEKAGIEGVINDFLGRVLANPNINGYFLNVGYDEDDNLAKCLVKQVSAVAGAPDVSYPAAGEPADADGCKNMKDSHENLGISEADFNDLVTDLVAVLEEKNVAEADVTAITDALGGTKNDIVEDSGNDDTIYQRVGRRPGIEALIGVFVGKVLANEEINGFFAAPNATRLQVCLVRQVCEVGGGPCKYGEEVDNEYEETYGEDPADPDDNDVGLDEQCLGMQASHEDLVDDEDNKIDIDDFNALVGEFVAAIEDINADATNGVTISEEDTAAIGAALTGLCNEIVFDPNQGAGCPVE